VEKILSPNPDTAQHAGSRAKDELIFTTAGALAAARFEQPSARDSRQRAAIAASLS
jgi:hypothetical protein